MFEARLGSTEILKKVVESIKEISNVGLFDCSDGGIQVVAMDGARASVVSMGLYSDGFDYYRCDNDFVMKIHLECMAKMLKYANSDDSITIQTQLGADTVSFILESKEQGKLSGYQMTLMDPNEPLLIVPRTEFACVIRLPSYQFRGICRDLSQFGDSIDFTYTKDNVRFSSSSDHHYFVRSEDESLTKEIEETCKLTFDCRYLNLFTKAASLSQNVQLAMGPNLPLMVEYRITNLGYVRYYLAPKVQ